MEYKTAVYSKSKVLECLMLLKNFSFDVVKLSCLEGVREIESLYNQIYRNTGCFLFIPENERYFLNFRNAVVYNHTKAEKKKALRSIERYLKNEVLDIYNMVKYDV